MRHHPYILLSFMLFFAWLPSAHAQFVPEPLSLIAQPSAPSPREVFTVTANTPTFDRNTAFFEWIIDGSVDADASGFGKNRITLTAGNAGSATNVFVEVTRTGGTRITKRAVVPVADLVLTWVASTYTPIWYQGKALPTQDAVVSVIAVPNIILNGRTVPPENLIYKWSLDDQTNALTGIGEDVFEIRMSNFPKSNHVVQVTVEDVDKRIRKQGRITLRTRTPHAVIYPSFPLGGVETRSAATSFVVSARGLLDFLVEPFFFAASQKKELSYDWSVGANNVTGTPQNPHILTVNTNQQQVGTVPISVRVDDDNSFLSGVLKTINLFLR